MASTPKQNQVKIASYGSWESPLTAEKIAEGSPSILNMVADGDNTYLCEMRPKNKGRYTIVKVDKNGSKKDITDPDFNVRTFVHEYGGGAFTVKNGIVYASNGSDHAIYKIEEGKAPVRLTAGQEKVDQAGIPRWKGTRFADLRIAPQGLIAIGEHHEPGKPVENFLALIDPKTGKFKTLDTGYDFYSSPALNEDNTQIAWICWNNPDMPWSQSELWTANIDSEGNLSNKKKIAGNPTESIMQPQWGPDGTLYFISDRTNDWWNLYRFQNGKIENICPMEAEVGEAHWIFDRSAYAFLGDKIVFTYTKDGIWKLAVLDPLTKKMEPISRESVTIQHLRTGENCVRFIEGYSQTGDALIQLEDKPGYPTKVLSVEPLEFDIEYMSASQHVAFPSNNRTAYGFYYAPQNKDYKAPANEKPPLIVLIHGGPTSMAKGSFQLKQQFWTSRGFAVLDVNYGGSTGYGKHYRNLLNSNWGIVDVEDCENGAIYLAKQGLVDANKLVIRGGSAGGYTTLAALAFRKAFKAGGNYFGVADITALANDTHKFEQRYMEHLVGEYPKEKAIWEARSPINSVDKIESPLIIFQGEDDPIVPKNQSEMIYEALKKRGIKTELHLYPGEEHGFRQAPNIIHSLKSELKFYLEVFANKK